MIGKIVKVTVDRPLGSYYPKHKDIYYSVNYGYIEGIFAPDGEEQDAYILGVDKPVKEFVGKVIAIIHRFDDVEEKWVVSPENTFFTKDEILSQVSFQEKYFNIEIRMWIHKQYLHRYNQRKDDRIILTYIYPFIKIDEAYELFKEKRDRVVKIAVEC